MASRDSDRPNVLFVLTDDQGYWAMGCAGNSEIRTPNHDRLAETGIRFQNFFCVSPVCSASRASILTGSIPSMHGVHDYLFGGREYEFIRHKASYTERLTGAGYECGVSGKWHLGILSYTQKAFSYWRVKDGPYMDVRFYKGDGEEYVEPGYATDRITDRALDFLNGNLNSDRPFYASVHYNAPHSPYGPDQHPADLWDDYHDNCPFQSTPREPMHPFCDPRREAFFLDEEQRRRTLAGYFTAVTAMDANLGRLLDWLEKNELRENTLVVFTSDNGMNMGYHGIWGKGNGTRPQNMYDTSVKVPGLASRPGHVPQGAVCDELVSHYDIFPTLLEYCGLPNPDQERRPGRSFARLLRGEPMEGREELVVFDEYGPVRMMRTKEWKLVYRYPNGPDELYNLVNDPEERDNLVRDVCHSARVREMRERVREWFGRYAIPELDGSRLPVTGCGQTRPAYLPGAFRQEWPAEWLAADRRQVRAARAKLQSGRTE
jgi:arylsulfatase A-like enzyme